MKKKLGARNIAASVHQRLLNKAKETKRPFNELLQYYTMERFLYRLSKSKHANKFVLKGAMMLTVWRAPETRPTKDIDLLGKVKNDPEKVASVFKSICNTKVEEDGLVFADKSIKTATINEDADYEGIRVTLQGSLGTAKLFLQVDIGFGDAASPPPEDINYPTLLEFPAPKMRGYRRETSIAEKFHAMVHRGVVNSRMKDFYDIWLLSQGFEFEGPVLAQAIAETFARRDTKIDAQPVALDSSFGGDKTKIAQWAAFVKRSKLRGAPTTLQEAINSIRPFLLPVAEALQGSGKFKVKWKPGGPWK